jgi:hypothetical protein
VHEEFSCSSLSGGVLSEVVQAGPSANGRMKSALYLALPKRQTASPATPFDCSEKRFCENCWYPLFSREWYYYDSMMGVFLYASLHE